MIIAPSRTLWVPPSLEDWWYLWTAGKRQRASSGKAQRNSNGKITKNSATVTNCCCAICANCKSGTARGTVDLTTSGITEPTGCSGGGGSGYQIFIPTGSVNGTWTGIPLVSQSATICRFVLTDPTIYASTYSAFPCSGSVVNVYPLIITIIINSVTTPFVQTTIAFGGRADLEVFTGSVTTTAPVDCSLQFVIPTNLTCFPGAVYCGGTATID